MVKLGITRECELSNTKDFLNRNKEISIPLIASLIKERQFSESVYPYFNMIRIGNTFKRTKDDRFGDLDDLSAEVIASTFSKDQTLVVHDLASSNGTTSCHFYDKLKGKGLKVQFYSSDKFTHVFMVTLKDSAWTVVMDTDRNLMQYVGYGFVLGRDESGIDLVNRAITALLDKCLYPKARAVLSRNVSDDNEFGGLVLDDAHGRMERFPLVSRECMEKTTHTDDFVYFRRDLFESFTCKNDVVRALNILNREYFSDGQLKTAVSNILSSLSENGIFIMGRSHDSEDKEHNVTIFRRNGLKFSVLCDYMRGSEIRELVLSL